jgi:hypothetical protein
MNVDELTLPGPARSAAVGAIAGRLIMGGGCCRDRAHAIAPILLDAALDAARATAWTAPAALATPEPCLCAQGGADPCAPGLRCMHAARCCARLREELRHGDR